MRERIFLCGFIFLFKYALVFANNDFVNEWVAEIEGGLDNAQQVASRYGYVVKRAVSSHRIFIKAFR